MTPNDIVQIIGALIASIGGILFTYQRYTVMRTKELTIQASESAIKSQFQNLRDAIEDNRKEAHDARHEATLAREETAELRHEFARMDKLIHVQQRTITRMELLLRQFSKLVQQNGIEIPKCMQDELDDLIVDNEVLAQKIRAKVQSNSQPDIDYVEFGNKERRSSAGDFKGKERRESRDKETKEQK